MPTDLQEAGFVSDYQSDMLFHGLVKRLGKNLHTSHDLWWHHKDKKEESPSLFNQIWGNGFTMYGLLDKEEYEFAEFVNQEPNRNVGLVKSLNVSKTKS